MGLTCKFDTSEFRREFRARVLRSKRTLAEVTNEVTFQILREAYRRTPKADRSKIESLGITYQTMNKAGTKALKRKKGIYRPTTAFKLITLKGLWKWGPKPRTFPSAAAIDEFTRKKLAKRNSSVGLVASGFVPAMRAMIRKLGGKSLTGGEARVFKGTKGKGRPAEEGWNPFAEIEHATGMSIPHQSSASQARVSKEVEDAWVGAVDVVTEEMATHVARQVEKALHDEG